MLLCLRLEQVSENKHKSMQCPEVVDAPGCWGVCVCACVLLHVCLHSQVAVSDISPSRQEVNFLFAVCSGSDWSSLSWFVFIWWYQIFSRGEWTRTASYHKVQWLATWISLAFNCWYFVFLFVFSIYTSKLCQPYLKCKVKVSKNVSTERK